MQQRCPDLSFRSLKLLVALLVLISIFTADDVPAATDEEFARSLGEFQETLDAARIGNFLSDLVAEPTDGAYCSLPAVQRFLLGHAGLASGRNTIAVRCFYCSCDTVKSEPVRLWLNWTSELSRRYPDNALVRYLRGDALARSGDLAKAEVELTKAIDLQPDLALALNARGVVRWLRFEADPENLDLELASVDDLVAASRIEPNMADPWANRGLIGLRAARGREYTYQLFDRAIAIDPKYWNAWNGKAVAAGSTGEYWEYEKICETLWKEAPDTPFLEMNWYGDLEAGDDRARGASTVAGGVADGMNNLASDLQQYGWQNTIAAGSASALADMATDYSNMFDSLNMRGGVFMKIKEGENLKVTSDGSPRLAGAWFGLNYPVLPRRAEGNRE